MSTTFPFTSSGILVSQPFGEFFVTSVPARILLETAYSDRLKAIKQVDGTYKLDGSQRILADARLGEIGKFIDMPSATFPNTIILAANYREEDGLMEGDETVDEKAEEENEKKKWRLELSENKITGQLIIPTADRLAAIIDGQHRLFGFKFSTKKERLDFPLLCAIFFELPKSYQAFLFATVNANQKPVSKSQTYELFGYNVEDESPEKWTPEKLSVFLTRKLNTETDSSLKGHILVPAENDFSQTISEHKKSGVWAVSTATIVEGIVKLISSNPKKDSYGMHGGLDYKSGTRSRLSLDAGANIPPLRALYLETNDDLIYTGIKNYINSLM